MKFNLKSAALKKKTLKSKSVEKTSSKKKVGHKVARKIRVAKSVTETFSPIKEKMSKSDQINWLVDVASDIAGHEVAIKDVKSVISALDEMIASSVMPKGAGEIAVLGLFKIVARKYPAKKMPEIKAGTLVRNPATGEMMKSAGRKAFVKPAVIKPKIRGLSRLRKAMNGE